MPPLRLYVLVLSAVLLLDYQCFSAFTGTVVAKSEATGAETTHRLTSDQASDHSREERIVSVDSMMSMFSGWIRAIKAFILGAINSLRRADVKKVPERNVDPTKLRVPADRIPESVARFKKIDTGKTRGKANVGPTLPSRLPGNADAGPALPNRLPEPLPLPPDANDFKIKYPYVQRILGETKFKSGFFSSTGFDNYKNIVIPEFVKPQYDKVTVDVDFPPEMYESLQMYLSLQGRDKLDLVAIAYCAMLSFKFADVGESLLKTVITDMKHLKRAGVKANLRNKFKNDGDQLFTRAIDFYIDKYLTE
uniref:Uncharacterized protein n=1 Tax=Peronospora matthiolae TaxID=2874970 RepID=A0AAV1UE29_9STRA